MFKGLINLFRKKSNPEPESDRDADLKRELETAQGEIKARAEEMRRGFD